MNTFDVYQALEQITNDIHDHVCIHEDFNLQVIEKIIFKNLSNKKITQDKMSNLLGVSVRTIRNKMESYGLKAVRKNSKLLQIQAPKFDAFKTPRGFDSAFGDGLGS